LAVKEIRHHSNDKWVRIKGETVPNGTHSEHFDRDGSYAMVCHTRGMHVGGERKGVKISGGRKTLWPRIRGKNP